MADRLMPGLERRLKAEIAGEVLFDRFTRGRYATDASHYQIMPVGVVVPRTIDEAERAHRDRARREGQPCCRAAAAPRSAGRRSTQSLVVDCSKHLNRIARSRRRRTAAAWSSPASCSTS